MFLEAVERGCSVVEAAAYAGVGRSTVYVWIEGGGTFGARYERAVVVADEMRADQMMSVRNKAFEMALGGNVRLIVFLMERADREAGAPASVDEEETVGEIQILDYTKEGEEGGSFIEFVDA